MNTITKQDKTILCIKFLEDGELVSSRTLDGGNTFVRNDMNDEYMKEGYLVPSFNLDDPVQARESALLGSVQELGSVLREIDKKLEKIISLQEKPQ